MKKLLLSTFAVMLLANTVWAQAPKFINYQAAVRSSTGTPLASSLVQVRFTIHDVSASGTTLFQETNTVTTTAQGIMNTTIGFGTPLIGTISSINWASGPKFLEVELNTGSGFTSIGSQQMLSVPYALYAANAANATKASFADSAAKTGFADSAAKAGNAYWTLSGTNIYNNNTGKVGIGTASPSSMFHTQINGIGTYGIAPAYQGTLMITGAGSGPSASGIYAEGGWRGILGRNKGISSGTEAIGVHGIIDSSSSYTYGIAVKGEATAGGPQNFGVNGYASGGSTANYGVYGNCVTGASNYAAYFNNKIYATSASSSIKSFKIDHPQDPENKYLYHSSVESNDMMNIYNGNVTTSATGDATITLPSYFAALNKDFKYQLTCIGTFAQAIVAEEISGTTFKIKTDKPNVKVSWQVAGVRQDAAANYYRIENEVEKPAGEKGFYLIPEAYGKGPEMNFAQPRKGNADNTKN